uniref:Transmembrane protein 120 homolog n=1 Tax=Rhabditophanes sp. KR3021 TaxID=114890 RepID=A0AC35TPI5_9BILA
MASGIKELLEEWKLIAQEDVEVEKEHNAYLVGLKEIKRQQYSSLASVKNLQKKLKEIEKVRKQLKKSPDPSITEQQKLELGELDKKFAEITAKIVAMKNELPTDDNGWYLNLILGSQVKLKILTSDERYDYKQQYEKFKIMLSYVLIGMVVLAYIFPFRAMDALLNFLLVWYYCTLTIREGILSLNGSRIKGWYLLHHYVSCVLAGITLTWRDGACYHGTRIYLLVLVFYVAAVQIMQYKYQTGCLRRLHALGQRHSMDISVEGFTSWMFKGLSFIIPFLVIGYLLQLNVAYQLYNLYFASSQCNGEWQIIASATVFLFIGIGNLLTLARVVFKKFRESGTHMKYFKDMTKYRSKSLHNME